MRQRPQPRRGEIWLADLGPPTGRALALRHPVVVVKSNDVPIAGLTIVVPVTSQLRHRRRALTVEIPAFEGGLERDSLALCHNIQVLDTTRLVHRIGDLSPLYLSRIELRLIQLLGLAV